MVLDLFASHRWKDASLAAGKVRVKQYVLIAGRERYPVSMNHQLATTC